MFGQKVKIEELEREKESLKRRLDRSERERFSLGREYETLKKRSQELEDENKRKEWEIHQMSSKIDEISSKVTQLQRKIDSLPQKLSEIDIDKIAAQMSHNAWYGKEYRKILRNLSGNPILYFYGHIYEPGYEDFSATCAIYGYDENGEMELLYDKNDQSSGAYSHEVVVTGSMEKVRDYVMEHDTYVILK